MKYKKGDIVNGIDGDRTLYDVVFVFDSSEHIKKPDTFEALVFNPRTETYNWVNAVETAECNKPVQPVQLEAA